MNKYLFFIAFVFVSLGLVAQNEQNKCWSIDYETWNTTGQPALYIDCGNNEAFNMGGELTLEVWARAYTFAENRKILGKIEYFDPIDNGYVLGFENLHVYAEYFNPTKQEVPRPGDGPMEPDSSFVHIVSVYSNTSGKVQSYVNGILAGETSMFPNSPVATNTNPFIIGNAPWDMLSFQFYGDLDEVRVWNKALSQEEIKNQMFTELIGSEEGLVAYYNFNEATGETVPDSGPNAFNGVLSNSDHESTGFLVSAAPVGNKTMTTMQDVDAAWYRNSDGYHKIISSHGLTIITDIAEKQFRKYVVMGHNAEEGVANDLAPEDAPEDYTRTRRQWYLNCTGDVEGSLTFSLEDAGTGSDFPGDADISQYALLYRESDEDNFRAVARPSSPFDGIFQINELVFKDGYYALGYASEEFPINGWDGIENTIFDQLSIQPNPADQYLVITGVPLNTNIKVFNINGQLVLEQVINHSQKLDLSSLNSGLYLVEIESDGVKTNQKFIKN